MTIELGALQIPITATGRDAVLRAFQEIEAEGKKAGAGVAVPVSAPGAQQTATQLKGVESAALATTRRIVEQEAQTRANAAALQALENRARTGFQRISTDVARATADYRLGIIALEDYQQAIAQARQEAIELRATTGALSSEQLAAFDRVLDQIGKSARAARREGRGLASDYTGVADVLEQRSGTARAGVNRLISGIQQLGVVAIGARSSVGSLATGALISLGASAGITLAVVAGAAAIGYAWEQMSEKGRKVEERAAAIVESLSQAAEQKDPVLRAMKDVNDLLAERDRLLKSIEQRKDLFGQLPQIPLPNLFGLQQLGEFLRQRERQDQAALAEINKRTPQAQAAAEQAITEAIEKQIETLAKAIELRTASAAQVRQALGWLPILKARTDDETRSLTERNRAQELYNSLTGAFKKLADEDADARKKRLDGLRDEAALLVDAARDHQLTGAELERLRGVYERLTAATEEQNLTDRERLELIRSQRTALAELARATSQSFPPKGTTFGLDTTLGVPMKKPSLEGGFGTFGREPEQGPSFGAGVEQLTQDLDRAAERGASRVQSALERVQDESAAAMDELRASLAAGLAMSLTEGIAAGFEQGIASGSIGQGAQALAGALLQGLGNAAISFGTASLGIAQLMEVIKKALESLNPAVAIPAAIALIALGGALRGAAARMFGGSRGGGGGAATVSAPQGTRLTVGAGGTITNREPLDSVAAAPTATRAAARVEPARVVVNQSNNFIGATDHRVIRLVSEASNEGARRGLTFGSARRG